MQYLHLTETCNRNRQTMTMESKKVCYIIIRKRNTTNVFLTETGFEFPHLCEAEDMDSVITIKGGFFMDETGQVLTILYLYY